MKLAILVLLILAAPGRGHGQRCPDVDPASGYPVRATSPGEVATPEWLTAVARSAAYRWKVPSRRRNLYAGWERVQRRTLPPEPRWADDWSPQAGLHAVATLVLFQDSARNRLEIVTGSGDRSFDGSLASIVDDPMPASARFPAVPGGADSVIVRLAFGDAAADSGGGVIRFAAHQTRIELRRGTLRVDPPPGHRGDFPPITVKYDVLESGRVDPLSLEFVRSPGGRDFERAIREGLLRAQFTPPTSNCRPVAQTVVQTFGR